MGYTESSTGQLVVADASPAPSGLLYHVPASTGVMVIDTTVAVTVAPFAISGTNVTGKYTATCQVPAGYLPGDRILLEFTASVGGVQDASVIMQDTIDTVRTSDVPGLVLVTPAYKLVTNGTGQVAVSNLPADYVSVSDITNIASAILVTPADKLATNASGQVAVSNLPTDYVSSADITAIVTAINSTTVAPSLTLLQGWEVVLAILAGNTSGQNTSTAIFAEVNNPSKTVVSGAVTAAGRNNTITP